MCSLKKISVRLVKAKCVSLNLKGDYFFGESQRKLSGEWKLYVSDGKIFFEDKIEVLMSSQDVTLEPIGSEKNNCSILVADENGKGVWEDNFFMGGLAIENVDDQVSLVNIMDVESFVKSIMCFSFPDNNQLEYLKVQALVIRSAAIFLNKTAGNATEDDVHGKFENSIYCSVLNFEPSKLKEQYKGISGSCNAVVHQAVKDTEGKALVYKDEINAVPQCICCGGITEGVTEAVVRVCDSERISNIDLTEKDNLEQWIYNGGGSYCDHGEDKDLYNEILGHSSLNPKDLFRWTCCMTDVSINALLRNNFNSRIGKLKGIEVTERGTSGATKEMRIIGDLESVLFKEGDLDRMIGLMELPSKAFLIECSQKNGQLLFEFKGSGTGNGAGICHMGAMAMSKKGFTMEQIVSHYLPKFMIEKQY